MSFGQLEHFEKEQRLRRLRLLFIRGIGCSREDWALQVNYFATMADVLALNLPGHGGVPPPPRIHPFDRWRKQ